MRRVDTGRSYKHAHCPDKDALHNKVIHSIQKSDFLYWCFTKVFGSLFLKLIGVPREVYKGFTLEQKQLAPELLDVMHPMSQRRRGSIHKFEIKPLDSASMREISSPTLILHARDDTLVNYEHAKFAHRNITQSKMVIMTLPKPAFLYPMPKKLFISLNTVKTHTKNINSKLNVNNRTKAIARAKELGLL